MIGKIVNVIVIVLCISLFYGMVYSIYKKQERQEKICAEKGMILVVGKNRNYCTEGFRP